MVNTEYQLELDTEFQFAIGKLKIKTEIIITFLSKIIFSIDKWSKLFHLIN